MANRAFVDDCIKSINDYRRIHQVSPLAHNEAVTAIAQRWAEQIAGTGSLAHNPNASYNGEPLGENCSMKFFSDRRDVTGKDVAAQWYAEVKNYDFKSHGGSKNTGHFTQLVWKSSREIGIGRAQSRDGKWYVVANFYPAGNYRGRNGENVFPPRDGKIVLPASNDANPPPAHQLKTSSGLKP